MSWQPIETAPEGEDILVYKPTSPKYWVTQRYPNGWLTDGDGPGCPMDNYTHWAPLEPPK